MQAEIATLLDRLLPEALERFLDQHVGDVLPRRGPGDRFRVVSTGAFNGRLAADLLAHGYNQGFEGALVVAEDDTVRALYYRAGTIAGATSTVLFERLGRILGTEGLVDTAYAADLVALEETRGLAAAARDLEADLLAWGLERRARAVAAGLYLMPRAHFLFVEGSPDLAPLPALDLPPMELAVEGLRRYDEWRHRRTGTGTGTGEAASAPRRPRSARGQRSSTQAL